MGRIGWIAAIGQQWTMNETQRRETTADAPKSFANVQLCQATIAAHIDPGKPSDLLQLFTLGKFSEAIQPVD